jgi:hypothetical protein
MSEGHLRKCLPQSASPQIRVARKMEDGVNHDRNWKRGFIPERVEKAEHYISYVENLSLLL